MNEVNQVLHGDCLDVLKTLEANSVDALVCDPPAGINFMNMKFDSDRGGRDAWIAWLADIMREALRVLKPGAHGLVWALPRTSHWTALALEDADFEIRDNLYHLYAPDSKVAAFYGTLSQEQRNLFEQVLDSQDTPASLLACFGSGFPKSLDVSKALDRMAGKEREVIGRYEPPSDSDYWKKGFNPDTLRSKERVSPTSYTPETSVGAIITAPATPEAQQWEGWGSALKPACEEWILVRKPLAEKSIAAQVLATGTGAINIDISRVGLNGMEDHKTAGSGVLGARGIYGSSNELINSKQQARAEQGLNPRYDTQGRFPSHLLLSHSLLCIPLGEKRVRTDNGGKVIRHNIKSAFQDGKPDSLSTHYSDDEGMETVEAWQCHQGGIISLPSFSCGSDVLTPLTEPSHLLDRLEDVLEALRSCNKNGSIPVSNEGVLSCIAHIVSAHDEGDQWEDVPVLQRHLSECAHVLGLSQVASSLFDCPSCLRLCGEHVHRLVMASQDGLPSLVDALSDVHLVLSQHAHTLLSQSHDLCNVDGSHQFEMPCDIGENKTCGSQHSLQTSSPASHTQCTLFETLPLAEPHDSTHENNRNGNGNHGMCVDNGCRSALVRLLVFLTFDISSHLLPIDIIQQKRIDINTSPCPVRLLDEQSGVRASGYRANPSTNKTTWFGATDGSYTCGERGYNDQGTASRYFQTFPPFIYAPKASRRERNAGCEALPVGEPPASARSNPAPGRQNALGEPRANHHPTVKSQQLMQYLCKMITPPNGIVLDMFAGSGSTGVACVQSGFRYILIEREEEYVDIIHARLAHAHKAMPVQEAEEYECVAECPVRLLGEMSGVSRSGGKAGKKNIWKEDHGSVTNFGAIGTGGISISDQGKADRFFKVFPPGSLFEGMDEVSGEQESGHDGEMVT